ncbi:MAG: cell division protein FtsL [Ilumatobacteraceae bacterium]
MPSRTAGTPGDGAKRRRLLQFSSGPELIDATPVGEVLPPRPLRSLRPQRAEPVVASAPAPVGAPAAKAEPAQRRAAPQIHRAAPMRTRTHGGADRATAVRTTVRARHHDQPMVRLTAGIVAGPPPPLVVVPRRRRVSRLITVGFAVVFALMLGAATLQTQLARRQVELDKVERSIRDANQQYNDLRRQRSELRSPERLATAAKDLGMRPATSTDFVSIDPSIVAVVEQSIGGVFDANATPLDPLDEFGRVKAIAGSAP